MKKNEFSVLISQCIVSVILVIMGFIIHFNRIAFLQPAQTAFQNVLYQDSGIEQVKNEINNLFSALCKSK